MKKFIIHLQALTLMVLVAAGLSEAVTISVNTPPIVGRITQITLTSAFASPVTSCNFVTINFGDGASATVSPLGRLTGTNTYSQTVNHIYNLNDVYTITATAISGCLPALVGGVLPPNPPAALAVTVQCPAEHFVNSAILPPATVGVPYSVTFQGARGIPPYTFQESCDGCTALPPGLGLNFTGLLRGTPTKAGTYFSRIAMQDQCADGKALAKDFTLVVNPACPAMSITTASLPSATTGQFYSMQLQTSGAQGTLTYSIASGALPGGLSLNTATGAITGSPATTGSYSFTVAASDSCASGPRTLQKSYTLSVSPTPQFCVPPVITSPSEMQAGIAGIAYAAQLLASGGTAPLSFSLAGGSLPSGLSLTSAGNIIGVPTASGSFSFIAMVSDSCPGGSQTAQATFSVRIQSPAGGMSATTFPSSVSVPRGRNSTAGITHQFTGDPSTTVALQSPSGVFHINGEVLDVNALPLTAVITNGRGQVSESVVVPVRIIELALQRGSNRFTYERVFEGSGFSYVSIVNFTITSEAGADFSLVNINLYFENRRPEITVPRNQTDLQVFADIRFMGSGLLQGFWEVDGRVLSHINQHLTYGSNITLQSRIPALPTFDPGNHVVRLIVTRPAATIPVPEASYYVTPDEARPKPVKIKLMAPADKAAAARQELVFEWERYSNTSLYLVQYFDAPEAKPIFTAYTKEGTYSVPATFMNRMFEAGKTYYWKVTGFDAKNNITGDSPLRSFMLQKP
ncbi:MAG: Ig domain-containing protein [Thermodesulfovibrionales bacterium]